MLNEVDYRQLVKLELIQTTKKRDERRTQLCAFARASNLVEFEGWCTGASEAIAAFRDTNQKYSPINGGLWIQLGERAARELTVAPYSQDKLEAVVTELREMTRHDPGDVFEAVQRKLAEAGVALVVIPKLKGSAFRGCTRLLHPAKAMIVHSLKYKNPSQFWRVLFHEIAHLILHIETPEDRFDDYEDQADNLQEQQADQWSDEILVYGEKLIAFQARHRKPTHWDLIRFADELKTSPAIVAEIVNDQSESEKKPFDFGHLRAEGLYPTISDKAIQSMWAISRDLILGKK